MAVPEVSTTAEANSSPNDLGLFIVLSDQIQKGLSAVRTAQGGFA